MVLFYQSKCLQNNTVSDLIIKAIFTRKSTGHQDGLESMYLLHVNPVLINIEYILYITIPLLHHIY